MSARPPSFLPEQPRARGPPSLCLQNLNCWPWATHQSPRSKADFVEWEGQQLLRGSEVRSSIPFSPLLGNKQGDGESGYQATVTAVRITASCDFRFLYSLERKQNILPEKKPVWGQEKKVAIALQLGSFCCHCFHPPSPYPLAASSVCCFDNLFAKHQGVSVVTDAAVFIMEQVYFWGTKTYVGMES